MDRLPAEEIADRDELQRLIRGRRIVYEGGEIRLYNGLRLFGCWRPGIIDVDEQFADRCLRWLCGNAMPNEEACRMSEPHEDVGRTAYNAALEELERIGWPCRLEELPRRYAELAKQLQEAREVVCDLYNQCVSTYEHAVFAAEDKLIEWGLLDSEQCLRRKNCG